MTHEKTHDPTELVVLDPNFDFFSDAVETTLFCLLSWTLDIAGFGRTWCHVLTTVRGGLTVARHAPCDMFSLQCDSRRKS